MSSPSKLASQLTNEGLLVLGDAAVMSDLDTTAGAGRLGARFEDTFLKPSFTVSGVIVRLLFRGLRGDRASISGRDFRTARCQGERFSSRLPQKRE